ncbi:cytochrome subunit of sulfide dehydrogenase [Rhodocyclaceae bacterium]|nr:cytochrome subunit of sulfide dehydrogenase [Rhodocyclaceae bacterium]
MKLSRLMLVPALVAALLALPSRADDAEKAKEINGVCATCHGEFGQGGKKGEYPRIAGQRAAYLAEQLLSYRERRRINIPMFPYTQERELSDDDVRIISKYLAAIELPTQMPTFKGDEDALTRLLMTEKVMIIPRVEGDIAKGKAIYQSECANCHAKDGRGRSNFPMLVGQYTNYLMKQMEAYIKGERPHDDDKPKSGVLMPLKTQDLQDILAYLTTLQNSE